MTWDEISDSRRQTKTGLCPVFNFKLGSFASGQKLMDDVPTDSSGIENVALALTKFG